jgi:hypothetical protein
VSGVQFLGEDRRVVSVGSNDRACMVWNFDGGRGGGGAEEDVGVDDGRSNIPPSQQALVDNFKQMSELERLERERLRLLDPFAYLRSGGPEVEGPLKGEMEVSTEGRAKRARKGEGSGHGRASEAGTEGRGSEAGTEGRGKRARKGERS